MILELVCWKSGEEFDDFQALIIGLQDIAVNIVNGTLLTIFQCNVPEKNLLLRM